MLSAIIRGRTTSCCFLTIQASPPEGLCNAARDWVGSCAITIKRRRDRTPSPVQSRTRTPPRRSGDRGGRGTPLLSVVASQAPGKLATLQGLKVLLPFQFFDHTGST